MRVGEVRRLNATLLFHLLHRDELQSASGADCRAGGLQPGVEAIDAHRALHHLPGLRIQDKRTVRAKLLANTAPDASCRIDEYCAAIVPAGYCFCRTDKHAVRAVAVIAGPGQRLSGNTGILARFECANFSELDARVEIVPLLASCFASTALDTSLLIQEPAVLRHKRVVTPVTHHACANPLG